MNGNHNITTNSSTPHFAPAEEGQDFGGGGLSRRSFLKRTGGATAATFIAWQGMANKVNAAVTEDSASSSRYSSGYQIRYVQFDDVTDSSSGSAKNWNITTQDSEGNTITITRRVKKTLHLTISHDNDNSSAKTAYGKPAWGATAKNAAKIKVYEWAQIKDDFNTGTPSDPDWRAMTEPEFASYRGGDGDEHTQSAWISKDVTITHGVVSTSGTGVSDPSATINGIHIGLVWTSTNGDDAVLTVTFGAGSDPANNTKTHDFPFEVRKTQ